MKTKNLFKVLLATALAIPFYYLLIKVNHYDKISVNGISKDKNLVKQTPVKERKTPISALDKFAQVETTDENETIVDKTDLEEYDNKKQKSLRLKGGSSSAIKKYVCSSIVLVPASAFIYYYLFPKSAEEKLHRKKRNLYWGQGWEKKINTDVLEKIYGFRAQERAQKWQEHVQLLKEHVQLLKEHVQLLQEKNKLLAEKNGQVPQESVQIAQQRALKYQERVQIAMRYQERVLKWQHILLKKQLLMGYYSMFFILPIDRFKNLNLENWTDQKLYKFIYIASQLFELISQEEFPFTQKEVQEWYQLPQEEVQRYQQRVLDYKKLAQEYKKYLRNIKRWTIDDATPLNLELAKKIVDYDPIT